MSKPNVLFVFADQHRYSDLASSGNKVIFTPNFDRLAEQGIVFDQAFSSHPLCSPFRGQLITGMFSHRSGVMDNEFKLRDGVTTMPHVLKKAGYQTGHIGKWHLGFGPYTEDKRYGFDYMAAYNCQHNYFHTHYFENENGPFDMDGWAPEVETSLAIKFLENHKERGDDSPFALFLGWGPPHWPYDQYPEEYNKYDPAEVELPGNVPPEMEAWARMEIANYYGNIAGLDAQMGRLMEALERLGYAKDTIVCYSSDHGDHLSSHGYSKPGAKWLPPHMRASKATVYEEAVHIPFILRFPGVAEPGQRTQALLSNVDFMPTLLSLCGLEIPETVQGSNLSHVVTGDDGPLSDSVYFQNMGEGWPHRGEWVGFWRGVRTDRWVYARWKDDKHGPWLFDRENDPYEMNNLAGNPEYKEVQDRMEARLKRWIEETDDPFDTGERERETGMLLVGQEFNHEKYNRR